VAVKHWRTSEDIYRRIGGYTSEDWRIYIGRHRRIHQRIRGYLRGLEDTSEDWRIHQRIREYIGRPRRIHQRIHHRIRGYIRGLEDTSENQRMYRTTSEDTSENQRIHQRIRGYTSDDIGGYIRGYIGGYIGGHECFLESAG
jgi:hypothetical protein